MESLNTKTTQTNLKDNLFFAGTIYDSFEALEEVLGKLKLERPLFLVYMAKKAFAEEVFEAAGEQAEVPVSPLMVSPHIQLDVSRCQNLQ